MRWLLLSIVLLANQSFAETIFQQIDKNGNTTFTDTPLPNSQPIIISPSSSVTPPAADIKSPAKPAIVTPPPIEEVKLPYKSFVIISPKDQQTFQNQREIPVQVAADPKLQKGDKVQLRVDGTAYGALVEGTQLTLGQLDRGTHTISAAILDGNNTVLKTSNSVTVYIHFANLGVPFTPP